MPARNKPGRDKPAGRPTRLKLIEETPARGKIGSIEFEVVEKRERGTVKKTSAGTRAPTAPKWFKDEPRRIWRRAVRAMTERRDRRLPGASSRRGADRHSQPGLHRAGHRRGVVGQGPAGDPDVADHDAALHLDSLPAAVGLRGRDRPGARHADHARTVLAVQHGDEPIPWFAFIP